MPDCPLCATPTGPAKAISGHPMARCPSCGLVIARDRTVPPGLYEAAYTNEGEYRDSVALAQHLKARGDVPRWDMRWVLDQVKPFGMRRHLDLGCGIGEALCAADLRGWKVHGVDASENACRTVREVLRFDAFVGTPSDLVSRGLQFEFVTAFHLLEHIPDPVSYLRDVCKLLVPGGCLGIAVPNYDSYLVRTTKNPQWLPPYHVNYFTRESMQGMLRHNGLQTVSHHARFLSWGGIEGSALKRFSLLPYLFLNGVAGRLRGSIFTLIARAGA
jgi:2-polyprenyl-3-methyl-5-hydroxy-6-metoxy-1,4-benzoquinol methylase